MSEADAVIPSAIELRHKAPFLGLLLCLFTLPVLASSGPKWFTRVWQIDDGLLDNNVISIVQGPDDYLWLATPIGLTRFDGDSFTQVPVENFTGPAASHVRTMLCSRTGVLWMGSDGGKVIGIKPDFSMILFRKNLPARVPHLAEGADGSLWLGYPEAVYHFQNGEPATMKELPSGLFRSLKSDGAGNIWLAKGDQVGIFKDGRFYNIATTPGLQQLEATHTNAVWFATSTHLFTCDVYGAIRDYGAFQKRHNSETKVLLQDHAGGVWIGTGGEGLYYYNNSTFERIEASHSSILSLAEDREGNIWAGTSGGGLDRISLSGVRVEDMEDNQVPSQIESICEDSRGAFWGAARNGLLISQKGDSWEPVFTNAPFAGTVTCVAADRTAVWIGTWDQKLFRLVDTNATAWETNVADGKVVGLLSASNGDLWIVGEHTLQCLRGRQLQNVKVPRQVHNIYAIAEDAAGDIWIGANGILVRFRGKNHTSETLPLHMSDRPICCLYGTADGSLWIGSRGGGLMRFKDGRVSQIGVNRGLSDNYISQMIADSHGWIWFGANHGVFKVKQRELEQAMQDRNAVLHPIVYGKNEGLASQEAVSSATEPSIIPRAMSGSDGRVWMLVHDGVVVGDPKILSENPQPPPVLLTGVIVDGQTIASYSGLAETQMVANLQEMKAPLRLLPSHQHLEFDFTAIRLGDSENVYFRYQLIGFDNDWIDAGARRSVDYTRLTAGDYRFNVEACIGEGPWSGMPATLALIVDPFFWQTWWFRLGILLAFASSLIAVVRYVLIRRIQARMRLLEQRATLDKERARIARDLHDELGSSLNYISMSLGDAGRPEEIHTEKFEARLKKISRFAVRTVRSLDEIVWAVNPRNDSLRSLVEYMTQLASELFEDMDVRCRFHIAENLPEMQLTPETRHDLYLAVKEALGNALVHAHATEIQLGVKAAGAQVEISIRDNGKGFDRNATQANGESNGLRNMQQRMDAIGGRLVINTTPGQGTTVLLIAAVPHGGKLDHSGISA
ncbi:MAG TPA: two-component regulator propeller domain-containing protein [Verrucomicrobiae bacterium]